MNKLNDKQKEEEKDLPLLEKAYNIRKHELTYEEDKEMREYIANIRETVKEK